jgi:hypothetical protein
MADVWSIKGITTEERARITAAAREADQPISRFVVRACMAAISGSVPAPRSERELGNALDRFERMARLAHDIGDGKSRACQAAKRTLKGLIEAETITLLPTLAPPRAPMIEGTAE